MQVVVKNLRLRASFSCHFEFISGFDQWQRDIQVNRLLSARFNAGEMLKRVTHDKLFYSNYQMLSICNDFY